MTCTMSSEHLGHPSDERGERAKASQSCMFARKRTRIADFPSVGGSRTRDKLAQKSESDKIEKEGGGYCNWTLTAGSGGRPLRGANAQKERKWTLKGREWCGTGNRVKGDIIIDKKLLCFGWCQIGGRGKCGERFAQRGSPESPGHAAEKGSSFHVRREHGRKGLNS